MLQDIHWSNYPCKNNWWGTFPIAWNFWSNWPRRSDIADFRSIFARSDSAVTPSEKKLNTNRKSTTRFPMSPRWTSYVVPKPSKVARKRKVSKIWTASCDYSETLRGCQLLLITDRKSHTGFRLVPTSMTLHDLERRNSPNFAFFREFDRFSGGLYQSGWR